MSLHGQNLVPVAFQTGQEEPSVAADFPPFMPALLCAHWLKCVVTVGFFSESQSSSKATDKATAGGWVAGWRGGYRGINASPHHAA